ncbi:MAG: c-type cytochrome [Gomphosphaeria aponina SAG 52.96 = DSM 107014]|uniref:Cytochrome c6 n=1 Tax=Gomphosphaeria aponina SAG 52.96 = DSM 107014 TaxID=1521640 RepID=A0A941JQB5_9CHRO|nr:c-type cytochrome [Gomphosphaeria aponina SAG 52.96 = DSM 107014]
MKRLILVLLLVFAVATLGFNRPAFAGDAAKGAAVFTANCNACHLGGKNVVNATKTLNKADLEKYDMLSLDAIKYQITKGKKAMPAFLGRLTDEQIDDVAAYVLAQAEKGW